MIHSHVLFDFVFSTYVEVILYAWMFENGSDGILHVCGGDPNAKLDTTTVILYSPRMWR